MEFKTANEAFEFMYANINYLGSKRAGTKTLYNTGFWIAEPLDNHITNKTRKWSESYAEEEFEWYLSEDRSVKDIKKRAKLWDTMHSGDNIVNSNYGYLWNRNDQLNYCIGELTKDKDSRRAVITLYDGKDHGGYTYDTPCTLSLHFQIVNNSLCLTVNMRSNDLWYGFVYDQYAFSRLLLIVAELLKVKTGWIYWFVSNMHLYDEHLGKQLT